VNIGRLTILPNDSGFNTSIRVIKTLGIKIDISDIIKKPISMCVSNAIKKAVCCK
jgi:hypothetical protein